ncbi:MAG: glutamate--tRNA ligase family protein [Candidatus Kaiserbacteria bacterium]|nr:glutamate--tRNA ligase family protein [Candidatus Kaiserbacteria bacterium]
MKNTPPVITRIAPSPTGAFHFGTARTALYNYLFAKKHGGTFMVRFEDTDSERSDRSYESDILQSLSWLNISPDVITRQSERRSVYRGHINRLLASGHAYESREPSKKDPSQEVVVIRYKNTERNVSFKDTVRGTITIDVSDLGDFVIARSIDDPLYNLAVAVDDCVMGITHVLRGDDHITNTPRQILLMQALGYQPPSYTHIPLIHGEGGGKLSKRKGALSVLDFKRRGYVSGAVCNALFLLGWSPVDEQEVFPLEDMVQAFSLDRIQKKEALFREKKLAWFNRQYVQALPEAAIRREVMPALLRRFPFRSLLNPRVLSSIVQGVREQGTLFADVRDRIQSGDYDFFFIPPVYEPPLLIPDGEDQKQVRQSLTRVQELLATRSGYRGWDAVSTHELLLPYAEKEGKSLVFWPLRTALSGREKSPSPFDIMEVIGKKQTMARIQTALNLLRE